MPAAPAAPPRGGWRWPGAGGPAGDARLRCHCCAAPAVQQDARPQPYQELVGGCLGALLHMETHPAPQTVSLPASRTLNMSPHAFPAPDHEPDVVHTLEYVSCALGCVTTTCASHTKMLPRILQALRHERGGLHPALGATQTSQQSHVYQLFRLSLFSSFGGGLWHKAVSVPRLGSGGCGKGRRQSSCREGHSLLPAPFLHPAAGSLHAGLPLAVLKATAQAETTLVRFIPGWFWGKLCLGV